MLHIRNSVKGVFFLENNGVPISLLTDFNEPIINGSLCVDRTNQDLYILKAGLWLKITSSGGSVIGNGDIIATTYNELVNNQSTAGLDPGQLYQFAFSTIHQIPNTNVINVATPENLIIRAVSTTEFFTDVISLGYPNDIIHYDFEDNLAEDGLTARFGKIKYRKNVEKNVETYYDFRGVKSRRWFISPTLNTSWMTSTSITKDEIILNTNNIYKCVNAHTSGGAFDSENFVLVLEDIVTTPFAWDGTNVNLTGQDIFSHTTFSDILTLDIGTCQNVSIGNYNNTYNNIVLDSANVYTNIKIDNGSSDMHILGDDIIMKSVNTSVVVGSGVNNINFDNNTGISVAKDSDNVNIGTNTIDSVISTSSNIDVRKNCSSISIDGSTQIKIDDACSDIRIAQNCSEIEIQFTSSDIYISNDNVMIEIGYNSGPIAIAENNSNIVLGANCSDINIFGSTNDNINIGQSCSNVSMNDTCSNIIIHNQSTGITLDSTISDVIIGSGSSSIIINSTNSKILIGQLNATIIINSNCNNTRFEDGVNTITLETSCSGTYVGAGCNNITFSTNCANNRFGVDCNNITLSGVGSVNNEFTNGVQNKTFDNILLRFKLLITDANSQTYTGTFSNGVANMIDTNNDIWYQEIDTLGSITTVKMS